MLQWIAVAAVVVLSAVFWLYDGLSEQNVLLISALTQIAAGVAILLMAMQAAAAAHRRADWRVWLNVVAGCLILLAGALSLTLVVR
ncbi:MAG TPA: hypothetical protein VFT45_11630 [Longimicrobium sp.]|nr:hypothetical protein [Longimicrobium sp.]